MRKIIEYHIASAWYGDRFREEHTLKGVVNKLIKEGWQPFGSPIDGSHQAMVKYEGEEADLLAFAEKTLSELRGEPTKTEPPVNSATGGTPLGDSVVADSNSPERGKK